MGMEGSQVYEQYLAGNIADIRHYCETDVLNTWLIHVRFQLLRGELMKADYQNEIALLKNHLAMSQKPHHQAFLATWQEQEAKQ
jgi:predicted PolB exonuclease-like 3'-5' exonuclease